ncbi:MAG: HAMP domain-containing protein [Crinalium sp.]
MSTMDKSRSSEFEDVSATTIDGAINSSPNTSNHHQDTISNSIPTENQELESASSWNNFDDFDGVDSISEVEQQPSNLNNQIVTSEINNPFLLDQSAAISQLPPREPRTEVKPHHKSSLNQKVWITASGVGIVSSLVVAASSYLVISTTAEKLEVDVDPYLFKASSILGLVAGITGFGTAFCLGKINNQRIKRVTTDLQTQFKAVSQGNLNARATVDSSDEFGNLATEFNQMACAIETQLNESRQITHTQDEFLQCRISLLIEDFVKATAGDLTVQSEVTPDLAGALAGDFNILVNHLRSVVQNARQAASEVNEKAINSENFVQALSTDTLFLVRKLQISLNSLQAIALLIRQIFKNSTQAENETRQIAEVVSAALTEAEQIRLGLLTDIDVSQQVEYVKVALDKIMQLSNSILTLVSAIPPDTKDLIANSRQIAKVIQSEQSRAKNTSQESQQISKQLSSLIGISQELLVSLEHFQIEATVTQIDEGETYTS